MNHTGGSQLGQMLEDRKATRGEKEWREGGNKRGVERLCEPQAILQASIETGEGYASVGRGLECLSSFAEAPAEIQSKGVGLVRPPPRTSESHNVSCRHAISGYLLLHLLVSAVSLPMINMSAYLIT